MRGIIVLAGCGHGPGRRGVMQERRGSADLESDHASAQLVERHGWAIVDADDLARSRSPAAVAVGAATSLTKLGAGMLALALVRPWRRHVGDRLLVGANTLLAALLLAWGGANVVAGSLSLAGAIAPTEGIDERALVWHVLVWDPGSSCGARFSRAQSCPTAV